MAWDTPLAATRATEASFSPACRRGILSLLLANSSQQQHVHPLKPSQGTKPILPLVIHSDPVSVISFPLKYAACTQQFERYSYIEPTKEKSHPHFRLEKGEGKKKKKHRMHTTWCDQGVSQHEGLRGLIGLIPEQVSLRLISNHHCPPTGLSQSAP